MAVVLDSRRQDSAFDEDRVHVCLQTLEANRLFELTGLNLELGPEPGIDVGLLNEANIGGSGSVQSQSLESSTVEERGDWGVMQEKIRTDLKRFLNKQTQRRPLIMPVILEV